MGSTEDTLDRTSPRDGERLSCRWPIRSWVPYIRPMTDKRLWTIGGVLFIVAAIASLVGNSIVFAGAFLAIGLLFLATPSYLEGRSRKRQ
jgi:hypothetical protein